jgi:hypothetical protein
VAPNVWLLECYLLFRLFLSNGLTRLFVNTGCRERAHRYEFCPTQPMAERPIIKKKPFVHKLKPRNQGRFSLENAAPDLDAASIFPGYHARSVLNFSSHLQFDSYHVLTYDNSAYQPGSPDRVTTFSLRDPSLKWANILPKYLVWFNKIPIPKYNSAKDVDEKTDVLKSMLSTKVEDSLWIDGLGHIIKVRASAIPAILRCIDNKEDIHVSRDF